MNESTTVTVGLDVHASSVRLAAIRGDELLAERTLPYDEKAVERTLRRWPQVRCCYEASILAAGNPLDCGSAATRTPIRRLPISASSVRT